MAAASTPRFFGAILYHLDVFSSASTTTRRKPCCFRAFASARTKPISSSINSRANTNQARKRFASLSRRSCATKSMAQPNSHPSPKRWTNTSGVTVSTCARKKEVMPLAQQVLSSQDWADIEAAFASHRDPLAGTSPETHHDQLLSAHRHAGAGAARARRTTRRLTVAGKRS